ncbi:MAG TPA: class I SAM-dependent methyltransferase [Actinomycetota bacterium]
MSETDAERIAEWHERAYERAKAELGSGVAMDYLDHTLVIPPGVFPPSGTMLGERVLAEVRRADRVLDMGTGSGVHAILAASVAEDVVAVDINPTALDAARFNAILNGVQDRIQVFESDLFEHVEGRFDLIVFDPPFRWFAPRDLLEAAMTDENYAAMTGFFAAARDYLNDEARMIINFGSSGDLAYLESLIDAQGFTRAVVDERRLTRDDWTVDYVVFRVTM